MSIFHSKYDGRAGFSPKTRLIGRVYFHPEVQTAGELARVITHIDEAKEMKKISADQQGPVAQQIAKGRRLHQHHRRAS